jgi:hypothetical protein
MDEDEPPPPPPSKPSQIPSWVMLGFLLGAGFVLALPRHQAPSSAVVQPAPVIKYVTKPNMTTIEAVFARWNRFAAWDNDLTEVALWNDSSKSFSDCFEVLRLDSTYYFRSIPRLTRPVLTHGVEHGSPLEFTETQAQRDEWLRENSDESWGGSRHSEGSAR